MTKDSFKKGDIVILKEKYQITNLELDDEKFRIFEGIQLSTNKKIRLKIYVNENFSNTHEVENKWKEESKSIEMYNEYEGIPIEFIESGVFTKEEKYFIIIYSYLEDKFEPISLVGEKIASKEEQEEDNFESSSFEADSIRSVETPKKFPSDLPPSPAAIEAPSLRRERAISENDEEIFRKDKKIVLEESGQIEEGGRSKEKEIFLEEKDYLKYISMEYFDRMNPQNYYPLTLSITDLMEDKIATEINPITGERKVQKQSKMDVQLKNPIVVIQPFIPGCSVEPNEIETDFSLNKDVVTFFITPGVKGKIIGQIKFLNEGKIIHSIPIEGKVVDPNYARAVAVYGIVTSFVPKIVSLLGIDFGLSKTLFDLGHQNLGAFGDINIASLIAIFGLIPTIIISFIVRQKLRPRSNKINFKIADFRLKGLKEKGLI